MNEDIVYSTFKHGDPFVFLSLRTLNKETLRQSECYLYQEYETRLCELLNALNISAHERRKKTWRLRMHFESHSTTCTPLYECSKCGGEVWNLGCCVYCRRKVPKFPWLKVLCGPAVVASAILIAVDFKRP